MAAAALPLARLVRGGGAGGRLYEVAVGLEAHVQLATATKLLSGAPGAGAFAAGGAAPAPEPPRAPNAAASLFDTAHPGALPVPGAAAVAAAVRAGLALRGEIAQASHFVRKHYFYADQPHGYQVTQLEHPIVARGSLAFELPRAPPAGKAGGAAAPGAAARVVRIERLQLETDTGKSAHDLDRSGACSLVDLNRAGVPLLEVVTAPDMRCPAEAGAFLRALAALLRAARVSEAAAEEGGLRVDVNVSVRPLEPAEAHAAVAAAAAGGAAAATIEGPADAGDNVDGAGWVRDAPRRVWRWAWGTAPSVEPAAADTCSSSSSSSSSDRDPWAPARVAAAAHALARFGPRVELKNLASIRAVERAVAAEAARQVALVEGGGAVQRETRTWDAAAGASSRLRGKEVGADYRFMREPDLAPLLVPSSLVAAQHAALPELPAETRARLRSPFPHGLGLPSYDAGVLAAMEGAPEYLAAVVTAAAAQARVPLGAEWQRLLVAAPRAPLVAGGTPAGGRGPPSQLAAAVSAAPAAPAATAAALSPAAVSAAAAAATVAVPELVKACANWVTSELAGRLANAALVGGAGDGDAGGTFAAAVASTPAPASCAATVQGDPAAASGGSRSALHRALPPARLGELVGLVLAGDVSGKAAKGVLDVMMGLRPAPPPLPSAAPRAAGAAAAPDTASTSGTLPASQPHPPPSPLPPPPPPPPLLHLRHPSELIAALGCGQLNDPASIAALAARAVLAPLQAAPPDAAVLDAAAKFLAGVRPERVLPFLVARVLAASGGRANPAMASAAVTALLASPELAAAVSRGRASGGARGSGDAAGARGAG